jgi:serine/threonine protein kinase
MLERFVRTPPGRLKPCSSYNSVSEIGAEPEEEDASPQRPRDGAGTARKGSKNVRLFCSDKSETPGKPLLSARSSSNNLVNATSSSNLAAIAKVGSNGRFDEKSGAERPVLKVDTSSSSNLAAIAKVGSTGRFDEKSGFERRVPKVDSDGRFDEKATVIWRPDVDCEGPRPSHAPVDAQSPQNFAGLQSPASRHWAAPRKKPPIAVAEASPTAPDSTDVERMVPRARTHMNLASLAADVPRKSLVRAKTYPDPFMNQFKAKFAVADPLRRDRQIQTLGQDVEIEQLYDLGSLIGSGGYGKVKDSTNARTFQSYAVKVMQKSSLRSSGMNAESSIEVSKKGSIGNSTELNEANFRDIMELLMNQRHFSIVTIERVFEDTERYYVVMPKCTGGDLRKHISALQDEKEQFEEDKLREVVRNIAEALRFLHGMSRVHRDIKPENVLYETEARQAVKLADFDMCCKCPEAEEFVVSSSIVGTLGYLAPEVLSQKRYSRQSDLFALGVLMHFCATLGHPKELVSSRDVTAWCEATQKKLAEGSGACARTSVYLRQAIGTSLSPSPHLRFAHMHMFLECDWFCGSGSNKKRTSLKARKTPRPDSIQRLLQMDEQSDAAAPVA